MAACLCLDMLLCDRRLAQQNKRIALRNQSWRLATRSRYDFALRMRYGCATVALRTSATNSCSARYEAEFFSATNSKRARGAAIVATATKSRHDFRSVELRRRATFTNRAYSGVACSIQHSLLWKMPICQSWKVRNDRNENRTHGFAIACRHSRIRMLLHTHTHTLSIEPDPCRKQVRAQLARERAAKLNDARSTPMENTGRARG